MTEKKYDNRPFLSRYPWPETAVIFHSGPFDNPGCVAASAQQPDEVEAFRPWPSVMNLNSGGSSGPVVDLLHLGPIQHRALPRTLQRRTEWKIAGQILEDAVDQLAAFSGDVGEGTVNEEVEKMSGKTNARILRQQREARNEERKGTEAEALRKKRSRGCTACFSLILITLLLLCGSSAFIALIIFLVQRWQGF